MGRNRLVDESRGCYFLGNVFSSFVFVSSDGDEFKPVITVPVDEAYCSTWK